MITTMTMMTMMTIMTMVTMMIVTLTMLKVSTEPLEPWDGYVWRSSGDRRGWYFQSYMIFLFILHDQLGGDGNVKLLMKYIVIKLTATNVALRANLVWDHWSNNGMVSTALMMLMTKITKMTKNTKMTKMFQDEQRMLLIFASCYLVAMTSVCTNPIMWNFTITIVIILVAVVVIVIIIFVDCITIVPLTP